MVLAQVKTRFESQAGRRKAQAVRESFLRQPPNFLKTSARLLWFFFLPASAEHEHGPGRFEMPLVGRPGEQRAPRGARFGNLVFMPGDGPAKVISKLARQTGNDGRIPTADPRRIGGP